MWPCQIFAETVHGKIKHSHLKTANSKHQLKQFIKNFQYLDG